MSSGPPKLREKAEVLDESALDRALTRIAHQILEKNGGAKAVTFACPRPVARPSPCGCASTMVRIASSSKPPRRPEMAWTRKHLLAMRDLDAAEITLLIDTAASLEEIATREIKKVPALRGKTIVNLFYEASTRTRTSFEIAGKWLSADVINFSSSGSSTSQPQSFIHT